MPPLFRRRKLVSYIKDFEKAAFAIMQRAITGSRVVRDRRVRAWFGCSLKTVAKIWYLLDNSANKLPEQATQERLLWALVLMKRYDTEEFNAGIVGGVDEGTFRKWSWFFIEEISYLEHDLVCVNTLNAMNILLSLTFALLQIEWDNRFINDIGNDCLVSVDGTDCPLINVFDENGRPDTRYYSYKHKRAGLRYEVALALRSENIVWIAGPYLPGRLNDISIFRLPGGLKEHLTQGERVEADDGYMGDCPQYIRCPGGLTSLNAQRKMRGRLRMRHEAINARMKIYKCLEFRFRHGIEKHSSCFRAAAVITQIGLRGGEEFMDMREYDDRLTDAQVQHLYGV